jgi:hypothetical protein
MAHLTEWHAALEDAELERALADLVAPWLVNFYVGWQECSNAVRVSYEEVKTSPGGVLKRIAEAAGMRVTEVEIEAAVDNAFKSRPRFNVGVSGRGEKLRHEVKEKVLTLASYYPEIEWTPVLEYQNDKLSEDESVLTPRTLG